jgi:beta-ureidopropionase / N-carbamoyl-L-amino-acid hydrolase
MLTNRRSFLATVATAPAAGFLSLRMASAANRAAPPAGNLRIDGQRLRRHIEELSVFGRPPGGTFADGVTRIAYSDADIAARGFVLQRMKEAALDTRIDPAGNLIGVRAGEDARAPAILIGSHIDTVPNGGNFDGALGSLAAIEVARTLHDSGVKTTRPIEVVVWANEEGVAFGDGLCGSRAAVGEFKPAELDHVWNGVTKAEAIKAIGGDPSSIAAAQRQPGSVHCYVELHIEQGGILARAGIPIGVVEGIVAIHRYEAVIEGIANHAGTTPMAERRDALLAAAHLTISVRDVVTGRRGRQVGTVGQIAVSPNAPNVVPGLVRHSIELRDLSETTISEMAAEIEVAARRIAGETGTAVTLTQTSRHAGAPADPAVLESIEQSAALLGLEHLRMPSGAGHDAQMLARICPMGMIFVPSRDGISHSPAERTSWEDCSRGADVLLHTVLAMDGTTVRS